jgi:hypothetical protein
MSTAVVLAALVRATAAASAGCAAAWVLLKALRVESPRVHRAAWLFAILQGWAFVPWTVEVRVEEATGFTNASADAKAIGAVKSRFEARITPFGGPQGVPPAARSPAADLRVAAKRGVGVIVGIWVFGVGAVSAIGVWRYVRVLRALPLGRPADKAVWRREWRREVRAVGLERRTRVHVRMSPVLGTLG